MNQGGRAVIYCRQSRDTTGEGAAVERQETACRGLATARGWSVTEVVVDNDLSASSGIARPGWAKVLAMVAAGEVDIIIAWHLDRITRTMRDLETLIDTTQTHGVGIATATGDIDLTTDAGRMVARILAAVARQEVERKGQRQIAQNEQRVTRGRPRWSYRPFGYEKDGTLREDEAVLLREAYQQILSGIRLYVIVRAWNEAGRTTTAGKPWTTQGLGNLLRDPRNAGIIRYRGEEAGQGAWEPIVDEDTLRVVTARMTQPERRGGGASQSDAYLVSVATCGSCGGRVYTTQHPGKPRHYSCAKGCIHLPVEWVDGRVFTELSRILSDPEQRARWEHLAAERGERGADLRAKHALLVERLDAFASDYAEGLVTREQMLRGTARVREQISALEAELAEIGDADRPLFDVEWLAERVDGMPADEVRALIRSATERVVLHRRGKGQRALRADLVEVVPKAV